MKVYRIKFEDMFYIKLVEETDREILIDTVPLYKLQEAALYEENIAKKVLNKLSNNKEFKDINMTFELEEAGGIDYIMEYGTKECVICKKEFELRKEDKFIVDVEPKPFSVSGLKEAFNCPYCGCQNIVNNYNQKYDINTKKVQNNENK